MLTAGRLRIARVTEKMQGHYLDRIYRIIDPLSSLVLSFFRLP